MSDINDITHRVIGAAIQVHKVLGPGLLESPYQACLAAEMGKRRIKFRRQVAIPVIYDDMRLDCGFRLDFLVEHQVVVEIKAVRALDPIFTAQVLLPEARRLPGGTPECEVSRGGCHPPAGQRLPRTPSACFRAFRGERCLNVLHRGTRGRRGMSDVNDITDRVIGAAIQVHKVLGPGLLESPYQAAIRRDS